MLLNTSNWNVWNRITGVCVSANGYPSQEDAQRVVEKLNALTAEESKKWLPRVQKQREYLEGVYFCVCSPDRQKQMVQTEMSR